MDKPQTPKTPADDFDNEDTVIDGAQFLDEPTPVEIPRCTECGNVVFFDDFTEPAQALAFGLFGDKQCVRARDGHWYYCPNALEGFTKYVFFGKKKA